jgi:hypothetical protein
MLREAQLKSAHAKEYPSLIPGHWYTAAAAAGLVKATRIVRNGFDVLIRDRVLNPTHFDFRGGAPRQGRWAAMRTRRNDRRTELSHAAARSSVSGEFSTTQRPLQKP